MHGRHPCERDGEQGEVASDQTPRLWRDTAFQTGSVAEEAFPDSGLFFLPCSSSSTCFLPTVSLTSYLLILKFTDDLHP